MKTSGLPVGRTGADAGAGAPAVAAAADDGAAGARAAETEGIGAPLLRRLLLMGCVAIAVMATVELMLDSFKPWNALLYPLFVAAMAAAHRMIGLGGVWDLRGRTLAAVAVNLDILATSHAGLFLEAPPLDLLHVAITAFWLPMGYTVTFAALPARRARAIVAPMMVAYTLPLAATLAADGRPDWPPQMSTFLVNVTIGQLFYVPLLAGIARLREQFGHMHRRLGDLHVHAGALRSLALRDEVTGLANRRAALEQLQRMTRGGAGTAGAADRLGVVMVLDLDRFKAVNDTHGHAAGDAVLAQVGTLLQGAVRAGDLVARWGGEEFVVLAAGLAPAAGVELAERLRQAVEHGTFAALGAVTVSIGVAGFAAGDDAADALRRADAALYRAKSLGRNRVCADDAPAPR